MFFMYFGSNKYSFDEQKRLAHYTVLYRLCIIIVILNIIYMYNLVLQLLYINGVGVNALQVKRVT